MIVGPTRKLTREDHPVTNGDSDLPELLDAIGAGGDIDVIREAVCPSLGADRSPAATARYVDLTFLMNA